nr:TetR/AcrR family transcriptional regulator [Rhodococcus sp. (in: high G+C Gram-positive bacteria)]
MPTQMRAVRTRDATITALAELIAERGYPRTSVTDIVEAAGLTKGALYFHFPSKEATVTALLDTASGRYEFLARYQSMPEAPPRQEVLSLLTEYSEQLRADVVLHAESVLWSDPDFTDLARSAGGYRHLLETLTALTTPEMADALMAMILGSTATPGSTRGLSASEGGPRLVAMAQAALAGLGPRRTTLTDNLTPHH